MPHLANKNIGDIITLLEVCPMTSYYPYLPPIKWVIHFYLWLIDAAGEMGSPEENSRATELLFMTVYLAFYTVGPYSRVEFSSRWQQDMK